MLSNAGHCWDLLPIKIFCTKGFPFCWGRWRVYRGTKNTCENKNTKRNTDYWTNIFQQWAKTRGKNEQLASYEVPQLNDALAQFFAELRWGSDEEYEPDSLKVMHAIKKQKLSLSSRKVLVGKARKLSELGMGKRKNKAQSLTKEEEEILWDNGQLGDKIPRPLINTVR